MKHYNRNLIIDVKLQKAEEQMDDLYVECLVAKKSRPADMIIKGIVIGLTVFFFIAGLANPVFLIPGIAGAAAIWLLLPNLSLEYEYLYISKTLEIDKIMSKQKRKKIVEYDLEKMEIFAEQGAYQLDNFKNLQTVEKNYSSREAGKNIWVMIVHSGNEIHKVILEPNEELITAVRSQYARKTFKKV